MFFNKPLSLRRIGYKIKAVNEKCNIKGPVFVLD